MENFECIETLYPNSTALYRRMTYLNDKLHGTQEIYYENGNLMYMYDCTNNLLNGLSREWWSNGNIRWSGFYIDEMLEGEEIEYEKG